jgi:hypothetical protein
VLAREALEVAYTQSSLCLNAAERFIMGAFAEV